MFKFKNSKYYFIALGLSLLLLFGFTSDAPESSSPVKTTLVAEDSSFKPGVPFFVAIEMKMEKNWHAYWKNPGDAGMAPTITWSLPVGFHAKDPLFAAPSRFAVDESNIGFGYEDTLVLLVEITPPKEFLEEKVELNGNVRFVVCSDSTCLPGESTIQLELPVSSTTTEKHPENSALFNTAKEKLPKKLETLKAWHDGALIELSFQIEDVAVNNAEFFPENEGVMNYAALPLFESSNKKDGKYSLIFEELSPQKNLKGILVVDTDDGKEAYEIDTPLSLDHNFSVASLNAKTIKEKTALDLKDHESYEFKGGVGLALLLAFIGGMILNLMPCVLPVISFKVLSFISLAGKQRKLIFQHGLAFSFGVLLSFWVMAALLLGLQTYGRSVGWGFQLQEPLFVAILAAFIFTFGLSLFGIFEIGTSVMAKAGEIQHKSSKKNALIGSFMSGILATAVATPCTGPFLGTTIGYAVTLPPMEALLIFTSVGLGMSFPYLALAAFPSLLKILPKPGNWMITFKEVMGFLMMASVIWLIFVFSAQTGTFGTSVFLSGLFFLAIACWIYGRFATPICTKTTRTIGILMTVAFFGIGSYTIYTSTYLAENMSGSTQAAAHYNNTEIADAWEQFSPERIAELQELGIPVFVDFTAKWCLICQANHAVLSSGTVSEKFAKTGVVRMKADWTKSDAVIAAELKKFGRNSVPLYVLYHGDKEKKPHILPQLLTPEIVLETLNKIEVVL